MPTLVVVVRVPPDKREAPGGESQGLSKQHTGGQPVATSILAQRRMRYDAALRLPPFDEGRRDPLELVDDDLSPVSLAAWQRALEHLDALGLTGLPPAHVAAALRRNVA